MPTVDLIRSKGRLVERTAREDDDDDSVHEGDDMDVPGSSVSSLAFSLPAETVTRGCLTRAAREGERGPWL